MLALLFILLTVSCKQTKTEASLKDTISIRNVEICSDIRSNRDYTVRSDETFYRGEGVWIYFEVRGLTVKEIDDRFDVWIKFGDLKLYNPNNQLIENVVDIVDIHETASEKMSYGWWYAYYDIKQSDVVGQYRFEFTITDGFSGATGTGFATFWVKKGMVVYHVPSLYYVFDFICIDKL
ncbi:hypothetical protein ACFLXP_05270 [Chloroflexota bacterium]